MIARCLGASILFALLCDASFALPADRTIAQFHHTSWTAKDGGPSQVSALAQTADGYLWIGTARGLFRFDGVRFERYFPPAGVSMPSQNIYTIMATPDGGLWISFRPRGLALLKGGRMTVFRRPDEIPRSWVYSFARDHDGRIWAGTYEGLALRSGSRWIEIGGEWNAARGAVRSLMVDREGTLWAGIDNTLRFLRRGSKTFELVERAPARVRRLAQSKNGAIWIAEHTGRVRSLRGGEGLPWEAHDLLFDREGALWAAVGPLGVARIAQLDQPLSDSYQARDGLSGDGATVLLEDREGNIWIGTNKGLDRFRYSHVVPVKVPPQHDQMTLMAGDDGDLWAGAAIGSSGLVHVQGERVTTHQTPLTSSVYRAPGGDIWWGGYGAIWRQRGSSVELFPQPKEMDPVDWVWEILRADGDALWVRLGSLGLVHFKNGVWSRPVLPAILSPGPSATFHDSTGRIWLGYSSGRVIVLDRGRLTEYTRDHGIDIGRIGVIRGRGPAYWLGGDSGLAVFHDGRFRSVVAHDGGRFGTISGIIEAADGTLWLNESRGVVRIAPGEVRNIVANPRHRARYQLLDFLDGMPGAPQANFTVSTAVQTTDGRLWFATDNGLARIDPATMQTNTVPPPVAILSAIGDRLPVGTKSLQIGYAALSLSIPERVVFRYKLEGVDEEWQDVGTRREAFYTNLRPGNYTFRVKAANNDGVWNEQAAAVAFEIPPAFFQTRWFLILCAALAAALLWAGYRMRLRQLGRRLQRLHDERMDERTRIARELHDTLLQGFLSASMHLHLAADKLSDDSPAKPIITDVIRLVSDVSEQGRQVVQDLRLSERRESLEEAFGRTKGELGPQREIGFRVLVEGQPRALHPLIRDEIYRIGREALVNAFRHSGANNIEVELEYLDRRLRLHIRDDGRGIDPGALEAGRNEHWGLAGMQERAQKIGAQLIVSSRSGAGSEIELAVPARVAYQK